MTDPSAPHDEMPGGAFGEDAKPEAGLTGEIDALRHDGGERVPRPQEMSADGEGEARFHETPAERVEDPRDIDEAVLEDEWYREPDEGDSPWAEPQDAEAAAASPMPQPEITAVFPGISVEPPREMDLGPARRGRWWMWALAAVAMLAVVGAAGYAWWWTASRPILVPDIVGKRSAEATQMLNDVGLRLGKVSEIPTDAAPAGTIISQKPEAGTSLKPEDAVFFVVAAPPQQTKVPAVEGVNVEDAREKLARSRLSATVIESYSPTVAAGFVIAQLPREGFELPPGTTVALVVSRGAPPTTANVPRLEGMSEADVLTLVKAVGLKPYVYRSPDASIAAGIVKSQSPLPGAAVAPGSAVQVLVSAGAGSATVTVPDVVGKTRKDAKAALEARGLVGKVVRASSATVAKGRVISQMPSAGGVSSSGGVVGLLVSAGGSLEAIVPSVVGTSSAEATKAIEAAGFRARVVSVMTGVSEPGTVFAQFPAPGTLQTLRFPVVCLVARSVTP